MTTGAILEEMEIGEKDNMRMEIKAFAYALYCVSSPEYNNPTNGKVQKRFRPLEFKKHGIENTPET